jgi:hypothetical protein
MRLPLRALRAAATVLSAVALATCADAPTGPGGAKVARLALEPVFSDAAMQAAAQLQGAGVTVGSIRLEIYRYATWELLSDQLFDVTPGDTTIALTADVTLKAAEEQLKVKLHFLGTDGTLLFFGEQLITARQGGSTETGIPSTNIQYVAAGAKAMRLSLTPADTTVATGTSLVLAAVVTDSGGAVIDAPLLLWTSSDTTVAKVSSLGLVTSTGAAGTVAIEARVPTGIGATAKVTLVDPGSAATLAKLGGDAQADTIEAVLASTPMVVELRDAAGAPLANQVIVWRAIPTALDAEVLYPNAGLLADASIPEAEIPWYQDSLSTITDAQGRTQMYAHLGWRAGVPATIRATAVARGASAEFNHAVKAGAPDWLLTVSQPDTMRAGLPADPALRMQIGDAYDNPVPLANVTLTVTPYWYDQTPALLRASTAPAAITADEPSRPRRRVVESRRGSGSTITTTASLTTASLTEAPVLLNAAPPSVSGASAVTDSTGAATFTGFAIGDVVGWYELQVDATALGIWGWTNTDVRLLPGTLAGLRVRAAGDSTQALPADTIVVEAWLADAWENVIGSDSATRTVSWSATGGTFAPAGGTMTSPMTNGYASVSYVTNATVGARDSVTATTPGLTGEPATLSGSSQAIGIVQTAASAIVYGAPTAIAAGNRQVRLLGDTLATPLLAKVTDAAGAPIANTAVEWRLWTGSTYATLDTTQTDSVGATSLQPVLSPNETDHGFIFEASPLTAPHLVLRFQAAARPDSSYDRVWFGALSDGATSPAAGDWTVASNWDNGVPTATSNVLIPHWGNFSTTPQLSASTSVGSLHASGTTYSTTLDIGGFTLDVAGNLSAPMVTGPGTVRMTGSGRTAFLYAADGRFEVAQGASVTVSTYVYAMAVDVMGTLTTPDGLYLSLLGGDLTVANGAVLDLLGSASIYNARSLLLDDGSSGSTGTGYIGFAGNFEQRATSTFDLDSAFTLMGSFSDASAHTITLANPETRVGNVMLSGSDVGVPMVTFTTPANVLNDFQVSSAAVTGDSLQVGGFVYGSDSLSDFSGLRLLDYHGPDAPVFLGRPAQTVVMNADASLWNASQFDNLEIRGALVLNGRPLTVNGALRVMGSAAALTMQSAADTVTVFGSATFSGANSSFSLTGGLLQLYGDLLQPSPDLPDAFRPDPALEVRFLGKSQRIRFETPADSVTRPGSYLATVRVEPDAVVWQASNVHVTSRLEVRGQWANDSLDLDRVLLLDLASESQSKVEGTLDVSRLNLHAGALIEVVSPGTLKALTCYNGGATINGATLTCTSQVPLLGGSIVIAGTSPLAAPAFLVATAPGKIPRRG